MKKTRSQIGRMSRNKGKRFELACRDIMADISGWRYWKRTQRGDAQTQGDLVPDKGPHNEGNPWYYVECRARGELSLAVLKRWYLEVKAKSKAISSDYWVLLARQDRGPILAICSWLNEDNHKLVARLY